MAEANVRMEVEGPLATVTVDRPKSLNALDTRTLQELEKIIGDLAQRDGLRGVILTGAGEKAFVAGADIAEMNGMDADRARLHVLEQPQYADLLAADYQRVLAEDSRRVEALRVRLRQEPFGKDQGAIVPGERLRELREVAGPGEAVDLPGVDAVEPEQGRPLVARGEHGFPRAHRGEQFLC